MFLRKYLWVCVLSFATLTSCKGDNKSQSPKVVVSAEKNEEITATEDALLGKRDALFNMRRDLQDKRVALAAERAQIQESGGDTSEVDDKARALLQEEGQLADQEKELNQRMQEILRQRRDIMAELSSSGGAAGGGVDVAGREAGVASRERELARREKDVAGREAAVSQREEGLASKWKDSCAIGATQTIVRTVDTKGSSYTKKDVEPLLSKARQEMSKKGLLAFDLPEQARGLEKEANSGMQDGDYGRARLAASQLVNTVRAIKVDKGFIAAKIQRLSQRMKGKSLSKDTEGLFREATSLYGDAKFSKANGKLNQIYGSL